MQNCLSIVIPAYNEEKGIESVLLALQKTLEDSRLIYEIIVVDDGSTDETASVISEFSNVNLIKHRINRGYGAALKTGIEHAVHDIICITDADGTYPNQRIPDLFTHFADNKLDMVVGGRRLRDSSLIRRPAKWFIKKLAEYLSGAKISDLNSGLRIFKKDIAKSFFSILPDGFSFTTTITLSMLNSGFSVDYCSIDYFKRVGKSKIHPIKDTKNFVVLILKLSLFFQPLKVFFPFSLLLFLLSVGWGLFTYLWLDKLADVSTMVLFIGSLQIGAIGLLAELINRRLPSVFHNQSYDDVKPLSMEQKK